MENKETNPSEIMKLYELLKQKGISFDIRWRLGGIQIMYPSKDDTICSAICFPGSYGYEDGLIEIMGLVENNYDSVEGYLTAEEVFQRIVKHYESVI